MSCFNTITIDSSECIGNSLSKINDNFIGLKNAACDNDSFITTLRNGIDSLNTLILNLSGIVVPGAAKAWLKFDGTRDTSNIASTLNTNRFIYSSFNISSVLRKGTGDYRITFATPFPAQTYTLVGTSSQKQGSTGLFTWFQPYTYRTTYVDVRVNGINPSTVADPEHCSVVIY
jgi:hypothetical protein